MSSRPGIHEDLHASDVREWQLWLLTLGLLALLGTATIGGCYLVLDTYLGDAQARKLSFRLLGGLALLLALFCAYVMHTRRKVGKVKLFLNEMSGMATGNLEVEDCLAALAKGMADIFRSPLCRIMIQRNSDAALELVSTYATAPPHPELETGMPFELDALRVSRNALESNESRLIDVTDMDDRTVTCDERALLTGWLPTVGRALVVPLRMSQGRAGCIVLGLGRKVFAPRRDRQLVATASILARHAGTVIDEAIRRRESVRDPLTDLFNRRHFKRCMSEELERAAREQHTLAILLCDLDGFKHINDSRGHQVGDEVLKSVATVLREATRGTDLHFRWGGDEMVVILTNTSEEGALIASERIRDGIATYAARTKLSLGASIGIAVYPSHGSTEEELVRVADLAMYVAKRSGDRVRVGFEEYSLDERCVTFVYQPIRHIESSDILGHEVYVRDPGGNMSPLELFQKYRAVGQLRRLKRLIFRRQIERARDAGVHRLFLNTDLGFLNGVDPAPIPEGLEVVLELSERDSNPRVESRLAAVFRWRQAGYRIALDDFGAGYVSLPILAKLMPDYIKVDRSCIVNAMESSRYREFLRHLLRGAAEFTDECIIAEGIEQPAELQLAREIGIPYAQGFLLGRPATVADVEVGEPGVAESHLG